MKTLKNAGTMTLTCMLIILSLAALQAYGMWSLSQSVAETVFAFCLWSLAMIPLPGLWVLATFPGFPVSSGLGLPKVPEFRRWAQTFTVATGLFSLASAGVLFVSGNSLLNIVAATLTTFTTVLLSLRMLLNFKAIPHRKAALKKAIVAFEPRAIIYTARADGGAYQIQQWLPMVLSVIPNTLVVTRDATAASILAQDLPTGTAIVSCQENADLDFVMLGSARIAFYVNSVSSNSTAVNYRSLQHVYLGHGDSDKEISAHPAHRMYDKIFVSGQAAIDRYAAANITLDADQAVVVGRPQMAGLHSISAPQRINTVLYAPTWSGYNQASSLSSLKRAEPFIKDCLARGLRVIFRPHPFSLKRGEDAKYVEAIDALLSSDGGDHVGSMGSSTRLLTDVFNESDALISDISSVVVDYLTTSKPISILINTDDITEFRRKYPTAASAYLADSPDSAAWRHLFEADIRFSERQRSATYYVADSSVESFDRAVHSILDSMAAPQPSR
ncbi:CDP-glycerol glycerophosphotransferase family protein [Paeniglutamicibacter sp. Y32M11]|uniref:CDP-glycerol glycerophosphotransferase family protein n=1 Tax=Paeniglutamicibacter sp. Y32M11 TaxID=2853258 RepID=UPI001C52F25A|nr:CDP-glycerol glycerophosphotransferase family protein [Paeniglutamicibacter sp. Y32M11]QXQ08937.1 CDP-glycerol glycerophosphotransferase family protein [Paeniglutamicibacter sp. Y32M11]